MCAEHGLNAVASFEAVFVIDGIFRCFLLALHAAMNSLAHVGACLAQ
jgi:hypothetical protein